MARPEVLLWTSDDSERGQLVSRAAGILRGGGLVVYPTDTVYGLGAHPARADAIRRIYAVKGRPDEKAIIWLVSSAEEVRPICRFTQEAERLAARFWPGPLTLVLQRQAPSVGQLPTLAVRVPAHPAALALIEASGGVVATTSANRTGQPSARTAQDALAQLGDQIDLIIDAGPSTGGAESTIIDLSLTPAALLREGPISRAQIEQAFKEGERGMI